MKKEKDQYLMETKEELERERYELWTKLLNELDKLPDLPEYDRIYDLIGRIMAVEVIELIK